MFNFEGEEEVMLKLVIRKNMWYCYFDLELESDYDLGGEKERWESNVIDKWKKGYRIFELEYESLLGKDDDLLDEVYREMKYV